MIKKIHNIHEEPKNKEYKFTIYLDQEVKFSYRKQIGSESDLYNHLAEAMEYGVDEQVGKERIYINGLSILYIKYKEMKSTKSTQKK